MDVTVIVPAYNAAATITECLSSIQSQTKSAAKVVLVDDRSTDDTVEVAVSAGVTNLEVLRLPLNGGPGAARNAGVALAETEWVAFLDADDLWEPSFLDDVCRAVAGLGADFGSGGGIRFKGRAAVAGSQQLLRAPAGPIDLTRSFWRVAMQFMPINSSTAVVNRALYTRVGGFQEDVRNGEDVSLWLRLWLEGSCAFVNRPLYRRVDSVGSLSNAPLTYRDVRKVLGPMAWSVLRAIARRKPGSGWLIVWFSRTVYRRHRAWLRRRQSPDGRV